MSDVEYIIRKICDRRQKTISSIESVAVNIVVSFGLANNTFLLPVVANTFYWIDFLLGCSDTAYTGIASFDFGPQNGAGSVGNIIMYYLGTTTQRNIQQMECPSMKYVLNSHSAGSIYFNGIVYKITTV